MSESRRFKVLVISTLSPEISIGGVERYIYNLFQLSHLLDCELHLLLPTPKKEENFVMGNVRIYKRKFMNVDKKDRSKDFFNFSLRLIKKKRIDCVLAENFQLGVPISYSLAINMVCFNLRKPLFLHIHSFPSTELQNEIIDKLPWKKVICISKSLLADCYYKGTKLSKLKMIYLGVNTNQFRPDLSREWLRKRFNLRKEDKIILHASRIICGHGSILKEKGIITLLKAFSILKRKYQNLKLVIAIASPPRRLHKAFIKAKTELIDHLHIFDIKDRVILKEFSMDEIPLVYAGSDLFVLASQNETLSQVCLEAMACGVPVIATKVGGIPEIVVDGYNGFLISPNDHITLAHRIEELITDSSLKNEFVKNALKTVRANFSAESQIKKLINFLRSYSQK